MASQPNMRTYERTARSAAALPAAYVVSARRGCPSSMETVCAVP